jgi:hypothetical protein
LIAFAGKPTTIDTEGLFKIKTVDSPSQKPVPRGTDIEVPLTDVNLDITQMNLSYFKIDVDIQLDLVAGFNNGTLPNLINATEEQKMLWKRVFIFVGYKHASDALWQDKSLHNTKDVGGTEQTRSVLESFLYHRVKPECELKNKAGTYSLPEDVENMDVSKCGTYISIYTLAEAYGLGAKSFNIRFPLIIPFDALLKLQGFTLYPKCTFGAFSLLVKLAAESLVIKQVSPKVSIEKETRLHHSTINGVHYEQRFLEIAHHVSADALPKRNRFHQLTDPIDLIARVNWTDELDGNNAPTGHIKDVTYTRSEVIFGSTTITALQIKSYIYGYKISQRLKDFLRVYFTQNPFVVPAEMVRAYSFPNPPNERGIDTQVNITITHATDAILLFPHHPNDSTCFMNPKYKDVSLKMLDQSIPDTPIDTTSETSFRGELQVNLLGTGLNCSESFENNFMVDYSGAPNERYFTHTDITDFALTFPLEVPSANALFANGAHSTQNTVISLTGNCIKQGIEEVYHNISQGNIEVINKTPPILCLVSNTFWTFGINPLTGEASYHYEINPDWNLYFQTYYPELYNRLLAQMNNGTASQLNS